MNRSSIQTHAAGIALALALTGATIAQTPLTDASGRAVTDTSKILSIGGDITEILYAIGAGDKIVAIDTTSKEPPRALAEKPNVGYMRALSTEGVLSVGATVIVASDRAGPPEVVKALKSTAVPYIEIAEVFNPRGVADKARVVSRIVGLESKGEELALSIEREFKALDEARAAIKKPLRALFVINVVNDRAMVGGKDTSADAILALAGAENAAASVTGFKPLSDEAVVALQPDFIVTMRRSDGGNDSSQLLGMKGMDATPAGQAKRILDMDGLYVLGFGPRAPAAARDIMNAMYPELAGKRAEIAK
jgi:iron complex transport system substrate-binding protein